MIFDPSAAVTGTHINWSAVGAISGPLMAVVAWIGRKLGAKLDALGEHLKAQDRRGQRTERRMIRVETSLGLQPLPSDPDD